MKHTRLNLWLVLIGALILTVGQAQTTENDGIWNTNYIARAVLTEQIRNREPVNDLAYHYVHSGKAEQRLMLFTQVINHQDQDITHLWFYKDNLEAEITLSIGSENWRTFSSKLIPPQMTGEWRVLVVGADQDLLLEYNFTVTGTP